jgi:uncharacterized ferredoxin-like protein
MDKPKAKLIDLCIAVGSAVKVAGELNMDNRIMHSADEAAKKIGLLKADEILGIPLSVKGKKISSTTKQHPEPIFLRQHHALR